jgi:hypothetical protein
LKAKRSISELSSFVLSFVGANEITNIGIPDDSAGYEAAMEEGEQTVLVSGASARTCTGDVDVAIASKAQRTAKVHPLTNAGNQTPCAEQHQ